MQLTLVDIRLLISSLKILFPEWFEGKDRIPEEMYDPCQPEMV